MEQVQKINNDYDGAVLQSYYNDFRNIPQQNVTGLPQEIIESTTLLSDISNIRLSSTIGLFNTAGGFHQQQLAGKIELIIISLYLLVLI